MNTNSNSKYSLKSLTRFLEHDIWKISPDPIKEKFKYNVLGFVKVIIYSLQGFEKNNVQIRASALTFFSLLSIVPLLAMAFGIAKGFALEKQFQQELLESFSGQAEVIDQSLDFAQRLLENTKGGLIAGIGFALLIYSVVRLFSNIEQSFNSIWNVKKERSLVRKLTDYLAIVLLAPVFLVGANSLSYKLTSTIESLSTQVELLGFFDRFVLPSLQLLPFTIIWLFFTLMYMIMPNTSVKFKSAFIAAILAGTTYQIIQWGLLNFQVGVAKYNAIYGSFAALPLFLFWLQISWLIFLFGAQIACSIQNVGDYENEYVEKDLSRNARLEAIYTILYQIIQRFNKNLSPLNFKELSDQLKLPVNLTLIFLDELVDAKILTRTENEDGDFTCYQPATDTSLISLAYVQNRLDNLGNDSIWDDPSELNQAIRKKIEELQLHINETKGSALIRDLV